ARAGALEEDLSGLVEQVARSKGMRVALLFSEATGSLKISCRTSASAPSVDAAALMAGFGGGGHVRAAGALVPSSSVAQDGTALREEVLAAARRALDRARRPA
ncbi:MAG: DHH family phosphoesterase, partial [Candidatus Limnocylindria bacterium]